MTTLDYPRGPAQGQTDTSAEAAEAVAPAVGTIRDRVLDALEYPRTTEEIAVVLRVDYGTVQPRTSELRSLGLIEDSGVRRANRSGKRAIVWKRRDRT